MIEEFTNKIMDMAYADNSLSQNAVTVLLSFVGFVCTNNKTCGRGVASRWLITDPIRKALDDLEITEALRQLESRGYVFKLPETAMHGDPLYMLNLYMAFVER